ncbi:hypothetical protein [Arthrobacter sp. U41]|uniref:hypothetical protein n=1 Tax=Arthrobacter sp. U41 TaxID=1849032 RepID=UPI0008594309|nr:hypothetical protein [Arthrobacter sp. U41]AOT04084.1 hypothetical protein ASPU41_12920 [Arthrobacter sp. U41]
MDSGNHDILDRDPHDDGAAAGTAARRRWPWVVAAVALVAVAAAGGIAMAGNLGSGAPAPAAGPTAAVTAPTASAALTTAPSPTVATSAPVPPPAVAAPATSRTATAPPSAGEWRTFTSADAKASLQHPAAWTVSTPTGAFGSGAVDVDVANESGVVVASLHLGPYGGLGGACQNPVPYTVLDVVEVDLPYLPSKGSVTPRFAFRALQETGHVTASYGLTSTLAGQDGTTCMFYNVVNGPAETPMYSFADAFQVNAGGTEEVPNRRGAKAFPTLDAARAYMQTPEYLNAKRMITSLKISAG